MKRISAMICFTVLVLGTGGCGGSNGPEETDPGADKRSVITGTAVSTGSKEEEQTGGNPNQESTPEVSDTEQPPGSPSEESAPGEPLLFEEEKGPHCFLGTIVEETSAYMTVEPAEGQEERAITDRVAVYFPSEHFDYLYGTGRRVVVYYEGAFPAAPDYKIISEDISTEGFREFELSVTVSQEKEKKRILGSEEIDAFDSFPGGDTAGLYYYGLEEVMITVDGQTVSLPEALEKGMITLNAIVSKGAADVRSGLVEEMSYDDGGSALFRYDNYTVIKYHTLDGNRDVYIGSTDMGIQAAD